MSHNFRENGRYWISLLLKKHLKNDDDVIFAGCWTKQARSSTSGENDL